MKAIEICLNTKKLLEREKEIHGVVHSVFNRVCNIETRDKILIPLISQNIPNMPRSISIHLPQDASMFSIGLQEGKEIVFQNDLLKTLDSKVKIQLGSAGIWDGRPIFTHDRLDEVYLLRNLQILRETLLVEGKLDGIASVVTQADRLLKVLDESNEILTNQYCVFIWPRFAKLIQWILESNLEEIQNTAKQIIGFGLGLTPSADDLLTGMMIAMIYGANYYHLDKEKVCTISHAIVEGVEHRTTRVSAEMLSFASEGEVAENIRQLIISIFSESDTSKFISRIQSVIGNGETSGSDCIAGIYIGCLLCTIRNKERKMKK